MCGELLDFDFEWDEQSVAVFGLDAAQRGRGLEEDGLFAGDLFGEAGDSLGDLALPKAIALDSDNHIYVVDSRFENIQIFDRSGRLLLFFGTEGTGPGEFWLPGGIFIDGNDRIWICDAYNSRIQVFDYYKEARDDVSP